MWVFIALEDLPHAFGRTLTNGIPNLSVVHRRAHVIQAHLNNWEARAHYVYNEVGVQVLAHLINIYGGALHNYPGPQSFGYLKRDLSHIRELLKHFYTVRVGFIYNYNMIRKRAAFKQHRY